MYKNKKKNIAIYGIGKFGRYVKQLIDDNPKSGCHVVNFIDQQEITTDGIECISIDKIQEKYGKSIDLIFLAVDNLSIEFTEPLKKIEYLSKHNEQIEFYEVRPEVLKYEISLFQEDILNEFALMKMPCLRYLECDIVGNCNLKCNSCTHYCNAVNKPEFYDINTFERDIARISQLCSRISKIRILGGEVFLHPELIKFIEISKKYYPNSIIWVWTNGLLIPKQTPEIWRVFRELGVRVHISLYPPTNKMCDEIENTLEKNFIQYRLSKPITKFGKMLTLRNDNDPIQSFKGCGPSHCPSIRNGIIAICPVVQYVDRINGLVDNFYEKGELLNIYDKSIDGWDILRYQCNPTSFCRYCTGGQRDFVEWANGGEIKLENWVSFIR